MKVKLGADERYPWVTETPKWDTDVEVEIPVAVVVRWRRALKEFEAAYLPIVTAYKEAKEAEEAAEDAERIRRKTELTPCPGCGKMMDEEDHWTHRPWCAPLVWPKKQEVVP